MIAHVKPLAAAVTELVSAEDGYELFLTGFACNTGATDAKITVYAVGASEEPAAGMELYSELPLQHNDTFAFTPIHLESGESLHILCDTGDVVFTVTGQRLVK